MLDEVIVAASDEDYEAFGALVREYWAWLQARYADLPGFIDSIAHHQALEDELSTLQETYGPPAGRVLLALRQGTTVGGIAYHDMGDGTCEMKRLFVPERFQGRGTGRLLCNALLLAATVDGFRLMRLDTGRQNDEAIRMYESLGFYECAPYREYPADLKSNLRFMERPLSDGALA
jgi:ribosomal protein S18 acetylase RimI-like enzyme